MRSSFVELLDAHAVASASRPAAELGEVVVPYGELAARSARVAAGLRAEGIRPGERVALVAKNVPAFFEAWFGAARGGAVLTPVNWRLAPAEVRWIVDDAGARLVVVDAEHAGVVEAIRAELPLVEQVLVVGDHGEAASWDDWRDSHDPLVPAAAAGPDDVVLQMYSSGTTGLPKGVMLTHRNVCTVARRMRDAFELDEASASLVPLPLFHIGGAAWAAACFDGGGTNVLQREFDVAGALAIVERRRVSHAFFVPAMLARLVAGDEVARHDVSSLRFIHYGASPVSEEVLRRTLGAFGAQLIQGYGLTECAGPVVLLPHADHDPDGPNAHRLRSAGRAMEGVEVAIADPTTGAPAPPGVVGEILTRSAHTMAGYWNRPDATAATLDADGWLHTGDAGYLDADGYLYVQDRVKDMIVSGGENIYPAEVENALMSHPAVGDCAVIGVPSDRWGETPKALVVLAAGAGATPEGLIAHCRGLIAHFKCPTSVDFVDSIPRNPSGKILKKDLRAPYWAGRDRKVN